jgi:adenylosuccinate lyase
MNPNPLYAISPLDGRYAKQTQPLSSYFSEFALIKKRTEVEVAYFIALCDVVPQLKSISKIDLENIRKIASDFSGNDALRIKEIESVTNHDVKAVEIFLREKFNELGLSKHIEFIHFGLTSQDINNTAMPLLVKESHHNIMWPAVHEVLKGLQDLKNDCADVPMLARTHGQPASPTLLSKEILVFIERIEKQNNYFSIIPFEGKFGGATGNFNAHFVSFSEIHWHDFADKFLENLGLQRQHYTTQIEHYDNLSAYFDNWKRINTILIDLCRDIWLYVSQDYFKQKIKDGEVGSSAMPHKVNPIDFENAEGNLGLANAMLSFLSDKLPVSRLQRDLTDSTVTRNIGVPLAHTLIALNSIKKGLGKLIVNVSKIEEDLESHWEVVAEAIQTILRRENYPEPYNALKSLTRTNQKITRQSLHAFILTLEISEDVKNELLRITPFNYTGKSN